MPKTHALPLDCPTAKPYEVPAKLRAQLSYFARPAADRVPALGEGEFWFDREDVSRWLEDGVFYLVSPLDSANMTEVELTEEQEAFLNWLKTSDVQHVRVVG